MSSVIAIAWRAAVGFAGRVVSWVGGLSSATYLWAAGGLVLLAFWLWISALQSDAATLERRNQALEQALSASEAVGAARLRALEALSAAAEADARLAAYLHQTTEEARHAPETDNGAVAPVLGRAFERLRDAPDADPVAAD